VLKPKSYNPDADPVAQRGPDPAESPAPNTTIPVFGLDCLSTRTFSLLLAMALFAAFPRVLLGLDTFFYRDFGAQVYPSLSYLRESLLGGEVPLWNPYNHCGVPFMAQWGYWYPGNLIIVLLPIPWSANFFLVSHLFFGGLGMYWLCRRLGAAGFAASFAGAAYVFNGVTMSCLMWTSYTASLAWLPWVLGCTMAAWRGGGRWIGVAALASACQVLTGTPEITILFWVFVGMVWLADVASREVPLWKSVLRLGSIVALATGLTMVQMLPFLDLLAHSQRDRNYGGTAWAMPGWGWGNLLVPLFHCYQAPQGPWFQPGQDLIPSYYLGAGVLALAIAGVWLQRSQLNRFVAGMALFCWIMALGSDGILFDWVKRACPLVGIARFPIKFAILPAFLIPLAAVGGIESVLKARDNLPRRILTGLAVVFLVLMAILLWFAKAYPFPYDNWMVTVRNASGRAALMLVLLVGIARLPSLRAGRPRTMLQLAFLTILPLDTLTHSPDMSPTLPGSFLGQNFWTAGGNPPAPGLGEGRIMLSPEAEHQLLFSSIRDLGLDFTAERLAEWYNLNLLDKIPKVTGASILRPAHFDVIERYAYYTPGARVGQGLLDFLSVAWVSSAQDPARWSSRTNYLPFVTAGQCPAFAPDDTVLRTISSEAFDPRHTVYLPESERPFVRTSRKTDSTVSHLHFTAGQVEAEVAAAETSLVVVSQSFYHLWHAFLDGRPARLMRANLAFQALEVPAGNHHVRLVYDDPSFRIGAVISLVTLVALCGLIVCHGHAYPQ